MIFQTNHCHKLLFEISGCAESGFCNQAVIRAFRVNPPLPRGGQQHSQSPGCLKPFVARCNPSLAFVYQQQIRFQFQRKLNSLPLTWVKIFQFAICR